MNEIYYGLSEIRKKKFLSQLAERETGLHEYIILRKTITMKPILYGLKNVLLRLAILQKDPSLIRKSYKHLLSFAKRYSPDISFETSLNTNIKEVSTGRWDRDLEHLFSVIHEAADGERIVFYVENVTYLIPSQLRCLEDLVEKGIFDICATGFKKDEKYLKKDVFTFVKV